MGSNQKIVGFSTDLLYIAGMDLPTPDDCKKAIEKHKEIMRVNKPRASLFAKMCSQPKSQLQKSEFLKRGQTTKPGQSS